MTLPSFPGSFGGGGFSSSPLAIILLILNVFEYKASQMVSIAKSVHYVGVIEIGAQVYRAQQLLRIWIEFLFASIASVPRFG